MKYVIRKMLKKDCRAVTRVITIAWNEIYKGIVPDSFLDNLYNNEEERTTNSRNNFNENESHQYVLEVDDKVVGSGMGKSKKEAEQNAAKAAIYKLMV